MCAWLYEDNEEKHAQLQGSPIVPPLGWGWANCGQLAGSKPGQ